MRESLEADAPKVARWLEVVADPVRLGILRSLSQVAEATAADLATRAQASSQTLRRHLEALVSLGVIEEHPAQSDGETPGRPAARFSLSSEIRESVRAIFDPPRLQPGRRWPVAQEVSARSSAASLAFSSSIASVGPMNGARTR